MLFVSSVNIKSYLAAKKSHHESRRWNIAEDIGAPPTQKETKWYLKNVINASSEIFFFSGVTLITITAVGFELEGFILSVLNRSSIHVRGIIGGNAVGTLGR